MGKEVTFAEPVVAEPLVIRAKQFGHERHHALANAGGIARPMMLRGLITRVRWTNPHTRLYLDTKSGDGRVVTWELEFGSTEALLSRALHSADLPLGTHVLISGFRVPGSAGLAKASCVTANDGRLFYMANSSGAVPTERGKRRHA